MADSLLFVPHVCGVSELPAHRDGGLTHVLSLLDPGYPDAPVLTEFPQHRRTRLSFHDIIAPEAGKVMPGPEHVEAILEKGRTVAAHGPGARLLVHCFMGISRSTAAMAMLMLQARPERDEALIFEDLRAIRPQAWPNSVLVALADRAMGRDGRLVAALDGHYAYQLSHAPDMVAAMIELDRESEVDRGRRWSGA